MIHKIFYKKITVIVLTLIYCIITSSKIYANNEMIIEWEVMSELGTLGGDAQVEAISADGNVIVGRSDDNTDNINHVVKFLGYDEDGNLQAPQKLGTLGGNNSYINAISADGNVIVGSSVDGNDVSHVVKFLGYDEYGNLQAPQKLGDLGNNNSDVNAISADGKIIVGRSYDNTNNIHRAVKFLGYGEDGNLQAPQKLGASGVADYSAKAISADGKIIVGQSYDYGVYYAVKFTDDNGDVLNTPQRLGTLGGKSDTSAISADGTVIIGQSYDYGVGVYYAVKFTDDNGDVLNTPQRLGTLGGNSDTSAISADGTVIVGRSREDYVYHAVKFLGYDEDGNLQAPQNLGALGTDSNATAISADGKIIVGYEKNGSKKIAFKHQSGEAGDEMINVFGSYGYANLLGKKSQIINAKIGTEANRFGGVVNIGKDETSEADVILINNVYANTLVINKDSKLNIKLSNIAEVKKSQ
ncbi:hypothetical protein N9O56_02720 [Rickettsiales bacterium]|nr:hypothetical protein [Rickettsiales bacterium]